MSTKAFRKIMDGLNEALAVARGEAKPANLHRPTEGLSDDERAGIERGLEDLRAGRFANDEEIAAIFRRVRSFRA